MQHHQIKISTSKAKCTKLTNFDPLLQDIRSKLGSNWGFYQEFLDGVISATAQEQDVSAWFEQVEQLVEGREDLAFSHQGVLFLLAAEMGVKVRSEAPSINNMLPPPIPAHIVSLLPSHSKALPALKMQYNVSDGSERIPILPVAFNRSMPSTPSSATLAPQPRTANIAVFGATQITNPQSSRLKNGADPIFFTDPTFKRDVQDFFGIAKHGNSTSGHNSNYYNHSELILPYNATEADLNAWKKLIKDSPEVKKDKRVRSEAERDGTWVRSQQVGLFDDE